MPECRRSCARSRCACAQKPAGSSAIVWPRSTTRAGQPSSFRAMRAPGTHWASRPRTRASTPTRSRRFPVQRRSTRRMRAHGTISATRCGPSAARTMRSRRSSVRSVPTLAMRTDGRIWRSPGATPATRAARSMPRSARSRSTRGSARRDCCWRASTGEPGGWTPRSTRTGRALAERPDDAPVRFALAGALAERDDLDAARAAYVHAARYIPPSPARAPRGGADASDDPRVAGIDSRGASGVRCRTGALARRAARGRDDDAPGAGAEGTVLDQFPAGLPGRGRPRLAVGLWRPRRDHARGVARSRDRSGPGPAHGARAQARRLRVRVLPRGNRRAVFRKLDHEAGSGSVRGRGPSARGVERRAHRTTARRRGEVRLASCPGAGRDRPRDHGGRPRLRRLSRARHGCDHVRARRASTRAASVCGLGSSGHVRAGDDRPHVHCRGDGACEWRCALPGALDTSAGARHALFATRSADACRARFARPAGRIRAFPGPAVAFQAAPGRRSPDRARARRRQGESSRRVRRSASEAHRGLAGAARPRARRRRRGRRPRRRAASGRPRRLPAHQPRVRRDARQRALVGREHEPRCHRLRLADRDTPGNLHARPAKRGDAGTDRRCGPHCGRRGRARRECGSTWPRMRRGVPRLSARMRDGSKALFDDVEPVAALATALDGR